MSDDPSNQLEATRQAGATTTGDLPEQLRRRYLAEREGPGKLRYFVDATATVPAFRDEGRRLSSARNDPHVIRDLVAIARHRGWTALEVRGQADFRREAWLAARVAGLEVRGYRPTERDAQALARRLERRTQRDPGRDGPSPRPVAGPGPPATGPETRMRIVEAVVRNRIVEPPAQTQILAAARSRLAELLERGRHDPAGTRQRTR